MKNFKNKTFNLYKSFCRINNLKESNLNSLIMFMEVI